MLRVSDPFSDTYIPLVAWARATPRAASSTLADAAPERKSLRVIMGDGRAEDTRFFSACKDAAKRPASSVRGCEDLLCCMQNFA